MDARVRALLDGRNFAHLATALPDGAPHSVAIWIGTEGDRVVFFTQPGSRNPMRSGTFYEVEPSLERYVAAGLAVTERP